VGSPKHVLLFRVLALLGVINAAIGAWYYLKIVAAMYLRTSVRPLEKRWALAGVGDLVDLRSAHAWAGFQSGGRLADPGYPRRGRRGQDARG